MVKNGPEEVENESTSKPNHNLTETNHEPSYCPTIKWKEHYISHYPQEISNLAPLPYLATDLFESHHAKFKTVKRSTRNSINILLTLTEKHELLNCYYSTGSFLPPYCEKDNIKRCHFKRIIRKY